LLSKLLPGFNFDILGVDLGTQQPINSMPLAG